MNAVNEENPGENQEDVLEDQVEDEDCMVCGESLKIGFTEKLACNHVYHYECILKTFQMVNGFHYYLYRDI